MSIMSGVVPMIGTPNFSRSRASLSGVWPPNWTITPHGFSTSDDLQHVLERQRLEVQPVGGVVVGGDGLRVAVDHDGLEAVIAQRHRGVHAAVVELDALPDAVADRRPAPDLLLRRGLGLALFLVRRVHVRRARARTRRRRCRRACRPAGCRRCAARAHVGLGQLEEVRQPAVGEAPCASTPATRQPSMRRERALVELRAPGRRFP